MATKSKANLPFHLPTILEDSYPVSQSVLYELDWEPCHFRLISVRDSVRRPLSIDEFKRRPMIRRSRYALRVADLATNQIRVVYHRLLLSHFRDCPLRVGIFKGSNLIEMLSTNWGPTVADRNGLLSFLAKHVDRDLGHHRIGIFSDDGEAVTTDSIRSSVR
jgi:hypothetical protein